MNYLIIIQSLWGIMKNLIFLMMINDPSELPACHTCRQVANRIQILYQMDWFESTGLKELDWINIQYDFDIKTKDFFSPLNILVVAEYYQYRLEINRPPSGHPSQKVLWEIFPDEICLYIQIWNTKVAYRIRFSFHIVAISMVFAWRDLLYASSFKFNCQSH